MAKLRTTRAELSGGVVLRGPPDALEVVLVGRVEHGTWALPKGTPKPGESREQTALRETREETGLDARIIEPIDSITYWFVLRHSSGLQDRILLPDGRDWRRHEPPRPRIRSGRVVFGC